VKKLLLWNKSPFAVQEVEAMSPTASPSCSKTYGVRRVCSAWVFPRLTHYRRKTHEESTVRRGPQGLHTDTVMLKSSYVVP
jgi:hypothetical protein